MVAALLQIASYKRSVTEPRPQGVVLPVAVFLLVSGSLLAAQPVPDRLRSLIDKAQAAEQQNRLDEAISLYEEILRIRPGWASAELNLGLVYHSRADYTKAVQLLTKALEHNPKLHSALLFRGASYYHTGRYDEAIRDLKQYLRHANDDKDALSYLALSSLAKNDLAEAALAYAALARLTGKPGVYYQLSECYVALARNAMDLLTGESAESYRRRIVAADQSPQVEPYKGDLENATRTLIRINRRPALTPQTIYELVTGYRRLAQAAVAKVIAIAPQSSWAALLRAQAAENVEFAEKEYGRAVASPDAELESYVRSGQFQAKQSRYDQALKLYEKALTFEPNNPRVMGLIGELHTLQEQPEKAIPFLDAALKANPRETQTRLYLAQSLVKLSRTAQAIKILEDAPEDPDGRVHYLLSRTYQQQGETEKARKAMEEFRKRRKNVTP